MPIIACHNPPHAMSHDTTRHATTTRGCEPGESFAMHQFAVWRVSNGSMLSKKSKIEQLAKSHENRFLAASAARGRSLPSLM
jgi:hypothetical protein